MKSKYIIGFLAILLFTSNIASATEIPLSVYKYDPTDAHPQPIPEHTTVKAVVNGNTVTVTATPDAGYSLPTDFDIQGVYLRINYASGASAVNTVNSEGWSHTGDSIPTLENFFGVFTPVSAWEGETNIKSGGPIEITYPASANLESTLVNSNGYSIVVKLSWGGDESNWVGGKTSIPEFPSIVLPVAAIIGIMFIFGRSKKN